MIWSLDYDVEGNRCLLSAIHKTMFPPNPTPLEGKRIPKVHAESTLSVTDSRSDIWLCHSMLAGTANGVRLQIRSFPEFSGCSRGIGMLSWF